MVKAHRLSDIAIGRKRNTGRGRAGDKWRATEIEKSDRGRNFWPRQALCTTTASSDVRSAAVAPPCAQSSITLSANMFRFRGEHCASPERIGAATSLNPARAATESDRV